MFGSIIGAVAAPLIGSMLGGNNTSTPAPTATQLPNMGGMANQYQSLLNQYAPLASQYYGMAPSYANQAFSGLYNNPYAAAYTGAAATGGQMAGANAPVLQNQGLNMMGGANTLLNTAFDPQSALYNHLLGQVTNETNAQQALRGLGNSPQGAQEMGNTLNNFNLLWQQQQLQRQLQGLQGAGAGMTTGGNLMMGAPQQAIYAGQMPYSAQQAVGQGQFGAIGALGGAQTTGLAPLTQQIGMTGQYLGLGNQAAQQAYGQALQNQQLQNQGAMGGAYFGQQLAPVIGQGLSSLFSSGSAAPQTAWV